MLVELRRIVLVNDVGGVGHLGTLSSACSHPERAEKSSALPIGVVASWFDWEHEGSAALKLMLSVVSACPAGVRLLVGTR